MAGKKRKASSGHANGRHGANRRPQGASREIVVVNPMLLQKTQRETVPEGPKAKKVKSDAQAASRKAVCKKKQRLHAVQLLPVDREDQCLSAVYWILLSRSVQRQCVVVIPNQHSAWKVPQLSAMWKQLEFTSLCLHKKMSTTQMKQTIERFKLESESSARRSVVLVVTEHFLPRVLAAHNTPIDVILMQVEPKVQYTGSVHSMYQVVITKPVAMDDELARYGPPFTKATAQFLQSRIKIATQVAELCSQVEHLTDVDGKWLSKVTNGAELDDEDEDVEDKAKKLKRQQTPRKQRLQALSERLRLLLARKIPGFRGNEKTSTDVQPSKQKALNTEQELEKFQVLGVVSVSASVGSAVSHERTSAQTQWLDQAAGISYGGTWDGAIRHGASCDAASLAFREQFASSALQSAQQWQPNREPSDIEKWGGAYGKACGHNEVVMHRLRPFFPQEVLNSRVCSRSCPAPGNQGFDGCLEFLRLQCIHHRSCMTVWDAESFLFLRPSGRIETIKKTELLVLPLSSLRCVMANMRIWTVLTKGQVAPQHILQAVQLCATLGCGEKRSPCLEMKYMKRIMGFVLGSSVRHWRVISQTTLQPTVSVLP